VALPGVAGTGGPDGGLARVRALLPESLQFHLVQVLEKPDELVLLVDAAVWAGRLKLALPDLAEVAAGRKLVVKLNPQGKARTPRQ